MSSEIVDFLNNCYDRAEQRARAARSGPWKVARANDGSAIVDDAQDLHVIPPDIDYGPCVDLADCEHIADHDPQWRLADIGRKRRIVAEHDDQHDCGDRRSWEYPYVGCTTVRLLAAEFDHEPGYNESWRP